MSKTEQNTRIRRLMLIFLIAVLNLMGGCTKLVEAPTPSDLVSESNVYSTDANAIAVLNGIYISMNNNSMPFQGSMSISLLTGLSSDELTLYNGFTDGIYYSYYTNSLAEVPLVYSAGSELWSPLYNFVFRCNAAIEGLNASSSLSPGVKKQLIGEASFMRAFCYFYLVNLFGEVPLALTTDAEVNTLLSRSPISAVYEQIIVDLQQAESDLSDDFLNNSLTAATSERIRPTKWAAKALLARIHLYNNDWVKAEARASEVISNSSSFTLMPLNEVFLKNSSEAIWQIQPTEAGYNTLEARIYAIPESGPGSNGTDGGFTYLNKNFLDEFELNDQRSEAGNWLNTLIYQVSESPLVLDTIAYTYKYKRSNMDPNITTESGAENMSEYFTVLRLAELYLIRAEAKAHQGDVSGAQGDLNTIRNRAGLPNTIAADEESVLTAILKERRVELFTEWGHRWLDLKRTGKIGEVMNIVTPQKANGLPWQSYQQFYPLPAFSDLQKAPNLTQNPGY